jgi:hypothetical protein
MTTSLYFNVAGRQNTFIVREEWHQIPFEIQKYVCMAFKPDIPQEFVIKDRWGLAGDHKTPFGPDSLRHVLDWLEAVVHP